MWKAGRVTEERGAARRCGGGASGAVVLVNLRSSVHVLHRLVTNKQTNKHRLIAEAAHLHAEITVSLLTH